VGKIGKMENDLRKTVEPDSSKAWAPEINRKPQTNPIDKCNPEELTDPMSLYIYAARVIGRKLPEKAHAKMEEIQRNDPENSFTKAYFNFLSKDTLWGKIKGFLGAKR
jgi:hypothetical protein